MSDDAITIFVSHKMPKDSIAAQKIGNLIALYSGNKIKILVAEDFKKGGRLDPEITKAIQSSDIFILLYTGEDEDWGYCLKEAGMFEANFSTDEDQKRLIVFHDPALAPPKPLSEYISVPINEAQVNDFLKDLYVKRGIHPTIDVAYLQLAANSICAAFRETHVEVVNFDLVPSFSIEVADNVANRAVLGSERLPTDAVFIGTQNWQMLFGKNVATGAWNWAELGGDWPDGSLYEPEFARMLRTAMKKTAPQGCFLRPHDSDELFRVTLRRYEDVVGTSMLKFYFTAAPIDIPIFGIHDTADKDELTVFNMINMTWYARRKLIDQLYTELLGLVNSAKQDPREVEKLVSEIKDELRSLVIQGKIRGISRPIDAIEVVDLKKTKQDELTWEKLLAEIQDASKKSPMDLNAMAKAMYEMAVMNREYYQISAEKYAETARKLELPMKP
jgi:hypothetical protein